MVSLTIAVGIFVRGIRQGLADPVFRVLLGALMIDLAVGTLAYMWLEGWRWIDALYFCVVTQATVGFGDLTPVTDGGKLFTVGYILIGVALIVSFAQRLAHHVFRRVYQREGSASDVSAERPGDPGGDQGPG